MAASTISWVVEGEALVDAQLVDGKWYGDDWVPFKDTIKAESRAAARWAVRRRRAGADPLAALEAEPPDQGREAKEIQSADEPRERARTEAEAAEYSRLVRTVKITSVQETTS